LPATIKATSDPMTPSVVGAGIIRFHNELLPPGFSSLRSLCILMQGIPDILQTWRDNNHIDGGFLSTNNLFRRFRASPYQSSYFLRR
jgi:hypothetical protein